MQKSWWLSLAICGGGVTWIISPAQAQHGRDERSAGHLDGPPVHSVAFSPDGATLAIGSEDGAVRFKDIRTGKVRAVSSEHRGAIRAVAFGIGGRALASACGAEAAVQIWDPPSGEELVRYTHWGASAVAFAPDGHTLASGGQDQVVRLWDLSTGNMRAALAGHGGEVTSLAFSPDGTTLASTALNGTICLWDAVLGKGRVMLAGQRAGIHSAAFTPGGKTLITAGQEAAVRLWDSQTGRDRGTLDLGSGGVQALAISPDGRTLAAGSGDGTVRIWDLAIHRELAVLRGHSRTVTSVAFAPDGKTVASASLDGGVRIWHLPHAR